MAQVSANSQAITITISDPVELERVLTVLKRSNSTKVAALREEIKGAMIEAASADHLDDVLAGFEKLLAEQE